MHYAQARLEINVCENYEIIYELEILEENDFKKINFPTASWNSRVCACCQGKVERIGGEQLRDNSIFKA